MIKMSNLNVMNFENAVRGARNPMNSWANSDSYTKNEEFIMGEKDMELARRLCGAGTDHRKFIRQIFVSVDIEAPLYWWKEFDTYKVGTVANSTSTMHKIHAKEFMLSDFSCEKLDEESLSDFRQLLASLERSRLKYLETKDKQYWLNIIQMLPASYNQLRTCTFNYENCISIYHARKEHKLYEWREFTDWILKLPYFAEMFEL